jgi:SAM-dependent methyltransferase
MTNAAVLAVNARVISLNPNPPTATDRSPGPALEARSRVRTCCVTRAQSDRAALQSLRCSPGHHANREECGEDMGDGMSTDIGLGQKLGFIAAQLRLRELRLRVGACPICGRSLFVRLQADPLGTRCVRCGASPITLAVVQVVREWVPALAASRVYEASSRGPLCEFLRGHASEFVSSEYVEGLSLGEERDGVRCEDLERLTFPDASFDLCTSTEVFEHVADDARGFAELHRVLRPGGRLIFSVPISDAAETVERAVRDAGAVRHLLPATYHDDRLLGSAAVLVYRDYGRDIVERVRRAGFLDAEIVMPADCSGMGHTVPVVVASKA